MDKRDDNVSQTFTHRGETYIVHPERREVGNVDCQDWNVFVTVGDQVSVAVGGERGPYSSFDLAQAAGKEFGRKAVDALLD